MFIVWLISFQTQAFYSWNNLDNILNSITELLEDESDQTELICDSYAIYKSGDLQFSRIQTTEKLEMANLLSDEPTTNSIMPRWLFMF